MGSSYRCYWALKEYPTSTDEQAILRHLGKHSGITLHIYARPVSLSEERVILNNAANRNHMNRTANDVKQSVLAEKNLRDMQVMALRLRMRGVQCYILAPLKGHEFKRACHKIGGTYIKLAPGSSACINVMEIRPTLTPEMELIDELDYSDIDSMLAKKIQQLMIFFSLLIPDMSNEEEQLLDEALV